MTPNIPEFINLADYCLDARIRDGQGERRALITDTGEYTYAEVQRRANRFAAVLHGAGVDPEQRVLIAMSDSVDWVAAFFGALKLGAAVVMANPGLKKDEIEYFLGYTRSKVVVTDLASAAVFREAAATAPTLREVLVLGEDNLTRRLASASDAFETFKTHRDDAALWLFSGGTTGRPKGVVQTHRSFINTTELYAKGSLSYSEADITLSVPKLFFGYATGSNLIFPFSVGATSVLFAEKSTAEAIFARIAKHRPSILINVPTMVHQMTSHGDAAKQDLSSVRATTSAGEALSEELYRRWQKLFGVPLLDGLGTAEMWHIFLTNTVSEVRPGSLGRAVPGFDVRVCDDDGRELPRGETGFLWVRGDSRAIAYWHEMDKTRQVFRGEWYASRDMVRQDEDGFFHYCGRDDDMLKVGGRWLAPAEVENCLQQHSNVAEAAVVGVPDAQGLVKPWAYVVARSCPVEARASFAEDLRAFTLERLEPYKAPRQVVVLEAMPRTHLGKIDRGQLKKM
ncbi:MAG: benzoate-CoA ligase family protein [Vicinamibacteria bacterium]|nr:benzoate-CoA ligase family protein [Vicinamibacteria bacterium]